MMSNLAAATVWSCALLAVLLSLSCSTIDAFLSSPRLSTTVAKTAVRNRAGSLRAAHGRRCSCCRCQLACSPLRMSTTASNFDYDLLIVGCGVGGHAAALHARANGLKTAVLTGQDIGGTCVNRGCVPSKALLAASGRVRELKDDHHLKSFGIAVSDVQFDHTAIANHASQLASRVKGNLEQSLKVQGVDLIESKGQLTSKPHEVVVQSTGKVVTARDIILAPGSVPFVPRGVQVDEQTVFTSDGGLLLPFVPQVSTVCSVLGLSADAYDDCRLDVCSMWRLLDLATLGWSFQTSTR